MAKPSKKDRRQRENILKAASQRRWQMIVLVFISCLLYAQTLGFGLVMDDNMVITDHTVVQQGVRGIGTLLTKDSYYGFDAFYDREGQRKTYRPVSFISFALEKQLWNNNPAMAHFVNCILYAAIVVLFFIVLQQLFAQTIERQPHFSWFPFSAALLFALHPVHTSVVANIKSRDEIFALFFSLLSALWLLRYVRSQEKKYIIASSLALALALLSKESAFLLVPVLGALSFATLSRASVRLHTLITSVYISIAIVYAIIWFAFVGRVEEGLFSYILYNPLAGASWWERVATGWMLLGYYLAKAIFPWTLSEGYTYNQIPVVDFSDWRAAASIITFVALLALPLLRSRNRATPPPHDPQSSATPLHTTLPHASHWREVISLCAAGFLATLLIASNIVVYSGSMLGERFLFTPSIFAVIALAYGVFVLCGAETKHFRVGFAIGAIMLIASLYAVRAQMRLPDWSSDYRLLLADHRSTPNSIMTARNFASQLIMRAGRTENRTEQGILLDEAESVIARTLAIDSTADAALYDLQALAALQRRDFDRALRHAKQAITLDSLSREPIHRKPIFVKNLSSIYVSRAAQRINADSAALAIGDLHTALALNPNNENAYINLGMIFGKSQQLDSALACFQAAYRINPRSEIAQRYIYAIQQAKEEAQEAKE